MTTFDRLDASALDGIAALCDRSLAERFTADELAGVLFPPDRPALVRGDPAVGIVATRVEDGNGFVKLLVVDPAHQGRGLGSALLAQAEDDLAGTASITVGADAPYFLFPGVDTANIAMLCLLERRKWARQEANYNVGVDLTQLPPDPGGPPPATPAERDEVAAWFDANWPNWGPEGLRALDKGTLLLARDGDGRIAGFCAYDVNRRGTLGPIAVRLDLLGQGVGVPLLVHALHRQRADGLDRIEVLWVGPLIPYARVGGTVSRVFFVYRKVKVKPS
jgi:mycothiol synthase